MENRASIARMGKAFQATIKDIAVPLGNTLVEQERSGGEHIEGEQLVLDALLQTVAHFANADGHIHVDEDSYAEQLILSIFQGIRRFPSGELIRQLRENMPRKGGAYMPDTMRLLGFLQAYCMQPTPF